MPLHLEPVTPADRQAVLALHTAPGQEGFVETVAQCLEEADHTRCWRPVAIYDGSTLIGFAMYGFFWQYFPCGRLWLDRLLIDARYQGQGYGKAALTLLLDRLAHEYPRRRKMYLSVVKANLPAICLYQKFGFHFTGELDTHGEKVMVRRRPAPK